MKRKYDPHKANHKAYVRRHNASFRGKSIVRNRDLRSFVEKHLLDDQSPEAISGRLRHQEKDLPYVSKNVIYAYLSSLYGKIIGLKREKKKRSRKRLKVNQLKDRVFIEKRPKIAEKRGRVGDLEADFIISGRSGRGILLTAVDRKFRISFIEQINDVSVDNVHKAFLKIKKKFPEIKSITTDNDILFKMHKALEKLLGIKIYFCHPYHSWEKGSIENVNKFIRKYISKGSDISEIDRTFIRLVEKKCNGRFMKCLKYKTPEETLIEYRKNKKKQKTTPKGVG